MKFRNKFLPFLALASSSAALITCINRAVDMFATYKNLLFVQNACCYRWRLGNIHYTKIGSGKPLLLIHDLTPASSGYEWSQIIHKMKDHYTVYTIDLLGFGRSEKCGCTYNHYLYVQLLCDFIKSEIGHRTHVSVTGAASSIVVMACSSNPELFDQIMMINPEEIYHYNQLPGKYSKLYKLVLDLPVIGTLLYQIAVSRSSIMKKFVTEYFYNPYTVKPVYIDAYYEAAHLGRLPQFTYASLECHYIKSSITSALKKVNNSIYIVGGEGVEQIKRILEEYEEYNPAIEYSIIPHTRKLPQLEKPGDILNLMHIFFS